MTPLNFADHWLKYYAAMAGKPPRDTLLAALERFEQEPALIAPLAIDLGCGEGRDTVELLRRGWRVLAIDGTPAGIDCLLNRKDLLAVDQLQTQVARFEAIDLPVAHLINASFSLPFCPPAAFPNLWARIVAAIQPGGRFAGQLFGERDTWAILPTHTHHSRLQVEELLQPLTIELLEEAEYEGKTALDELKHWHLFHIVARKPPHQ